ncbi:HpcH/HpaI aldolase [Agrobacterium vitis]|uniref:HpcH/HpaI aldolase n=1 Tax=Agrobacterium vitis TaxID=373 RepID=A0A6L6VMV8_AGRVI|nr:aldolase/citrate lyase family protein [Agrobacterium vitis]MUZ76025.1 HpcH/HpaI aldolase [Agrobacterium vitis]
MSNRVRDLWAAGQAAKACWLQIPGLLHAESLARVGFDALVIDLQHSPIEPADAFAMMPSIELGGAEPFVRLHRNEPFDAMKMADMGASGIIAPLVNTAEDVQRLVQGLDYAPNGKRSYGPRRPLLRYGAGYAASARKTLVIMAMIETREALTNLPEILDSDGLDGVFIGPTDLAIELGCKPSVDSDETPVVEAIANILVQAKARGKHAGIFCGSGAFARRMIADGFDFVSVAPDLSLLVAAAKRELVETNRP